jgi:hypothetical protein
MRSDHHRLYFAPRPLIDFSDMQSSHLPGWKNHLNPQESVAGVRGI